MPSSNLGASRCSVLCRRAIGPLLRRGNTRLGGGVELSAGAVEAEVADGDAVEADGVKGLAGVGGDEGDAGDLAGLLAAAVELQGWDSSAGSC